MEAQLIFREAISTDVQIFGWSRTRLFQIKLGTLFPRNREHMIGKLGRISETTSKCGFGTRCFCISGWAKNSVRHIKITNVSKIGMDIYHVTNSTDEFQKRSETDQEANQETVPNSDGEGLQRLVRCAQTFERSRQRRQREVEEFKLPDEFQYVT